MSRNIVGRGQGQGVGGRSRSRSRRSIADRVWSGARVGPVYLEEGKKTKGDQGLFGQAFIECVP